MTPQQFQTQMLRLTAQFPNAYGDERLKIIVRDVQHLDVKIWVQAVDEILESSKFAPMPREIREIVSEIRRKQPRSQIEKPVTGCSWCHGIGVFSAEKQIDGIDHSFAFRCHCAAGLADQRCFPRWTTHHSETYTPVHLKKWIPPQDSKNKFVAPTPLTTGGSSQAQTTRPQSEPVSMGSVVSKFLGAEQ